jgi:hypothetical protein
MLSKVCAVWFVVLIILPFTAPLSSVTLEELMPRGDHDVLATTSSLPATAATHTTAAHVARVPAPNGRFLTRPHAPSSGVSAALQDRTPRGVPRSSDSSSATGPTVLRI